VGQSGLQAGAGAARQQKVALAARYDTRDFVAETWLVISACLNRWGGAASTSLEDVAYNIACAIDELVQAISDLEARVKGLESKLR
jgi:hypothetical protein